MYSRQMLGGCSPTFGRVELDFEPAPEGTESSCEFACTARPEPNAEFEEALTQGVMQELAGEQTDGPQARRSATVSSLVIVRSLTWHWVDSCERGFVRLGALAVREALQCIAEDREPQEIVTRVSLP